jgi:hypothetical protein
MASGRLQQSPQTVTLCAVLETTLAAPPTPANEAVAVPPLTPQEFLFTAVEFMARERHGWRPKVLFKARQEMRVKAVRRGFGPGRCWIWALPGYMTDKDVHFHPGEWRGLVAGRREWLTPAG